MPDLSEMSHEQRVPDRPVAPVSTYRVQISRDFDMWRTAELAHYLAELGVSHLYASPLLQATPGSAHGYDVVDHDRVDTDRGGEPGRQALLAALRAHGLGLVVDIVPNHCGVALPSANPAWWDVLRLGPSARHARWFDIDWSRGPLQLPVLGDEPDPLATLRQVGDELRYGELTFPIAPDTGGGSPREVHDRQHYRLVRASAANTEVNYRRFFAVHTLAALRVEDADVFEATHRLVLDWAAAGECDGIRVDHPDGLADPTGYFVALRNRTPEGTWIIAEKILEPGERLPAAWPCAGTTGYDALREICGVFVDPAGEGVFTALDTELTGTATDWPELAHACKRAVVDTMLPAELARLARLAPEVSGAATALAELLSCFDVYRTYLPLGAARIGAAVTEAVRRRPELAEAIGGLHARLTDPTDELAVRFQQTTGAVLAKGIEDTAMYRWTRFAALNEVGGGLEQFGLSPERFHSATAGRAEHAPAGMTTLSTHDTKRGEDVRARLAVLAEIPREWTRAVRRWARWAPGFDGGFTHLLWQTAVGAWPIESDRLHAYAEKAMREAGTHTSWQDPDQEYERAAHAMIDRMYDDPAFAAELDDFVRRIRPYGWINSLGQKLTQLTMPGVPDVYQGCELWENSLVDPDNRRPVDFAARRALLRQLDSRPGPPAVDATGAAKLWVTSRALRARRQRPDAFVSYRPRYATGPAAEHALVFDRGAAITVVTRLPVRLEQAGGWRSTTVELPPGRWTDTLTDTGYEGRAHLSELLAHLPTALLVRA